MNKIKASIQLLRVRQYYKNLILFLGIFFANELFNFSLYPKIGLSFLLVCLTSSMIYIINDIRDMELDKNHSEKIEQRPLANGTLSKSFAWILLIILSIPVIFAIVYYAFKLPLFSLMLALILLTGILYNYVFKNIAFADIIALSVIYIWRALAGCAIIEVYISPWLTITVFLGALLLATGKRMADLSLLGEDNAIKHKPVYDHYSKKLLDYILSMVATSLFMTYTLYCVFGPIEGSENHSIISQHQSFLVYTTPIAIFLIIRYLYLVHAKPEIARRTEKLVKDIPFLIGALSLFILVICFLYIQNPDILTFLAL